MISLGTRHVLIAQIPAILWVLLAGAIYWDLRGDVHGVFRSAAKQFQQDSSYLGADYPHDMVKRGKR